MPDRIRIGARARLGLLLAALAVGFVVFFVRGAVSPAELRSWIEPYGAPGPLLFVLVATTLSCALVPGPILAGASGLLFGPLLGTLLSLASVVMSAVIALTIARRVGREGLEELTGPRFEALGAWLERHGFAAVVTARLAPGLPDSPVNYAAGLTRIRVRSIAAGTAVGSAPRAFGYAALGGSLAKLDSPLALVGLAAVVATGLLGAEAVRRQVRRSREARAAFDALRAAEE